MRKAAAILGTAVALLALAQVMGLVYTFEIASQPVSTLIPGQGRGYSRGVGPSVVRLVDFDTEGNLPTWFSALLVGSCAALLALVAAAQRYAGEPKMLQRRWSMLAVIFGYETIQDAALVTIEESLELAGAALFACSVLAYLPKRAIRLASFLKRG